MAVGSHDVEAGSEIGDSLRFRAARLRLSDGGLKDQRIDGVGPQHVGLGDVEDGGVQDDVGARHIELDAAICWTSVDWNCVPSRSSPSCGAKEGAKLTEGMSSSVSRVCCTGPVATCALIWLSTANASRTLVIRPVKRRARVRSSLRASIWV
ncbi:hypothetical protein ASG63_12760 [Methylobacterium sp. Leaf94]|nr:hypothetical protein ASG63_12760 [Methylobacterium sp. Leaf94]